MTSPVVLHLCERCHRVASQVFHQAGENRELCRECWRAERLLRELPRPVASAASRFDRLSTRTA